MCSGVLVGEIHRIARELDTAAGSALHEVGILIACAEAVSELIPAWAAPTNEQSPR